MHWNNRLVRHKTEHEEYFTIHEVFYNDKEEIMGMTENPIAPHGDSVEEIKETLERMLRALDKEPLDFDMKFASDEFNEEEEILKSLPIIDGKIDFSGLEGE